MSPSAAIVQVLWSSSVSDRKTSTQSLYSMRNGTGSQWRTSWRSGVMWSYFLLLQMSLTVALSTDWSPTRRRSGEQAVAAVHPRSDKSRDSRLRSPKRQQLDAAPDETELANG